MNGIKYIGPTGDFSGYGDAARNYILSLHKKGVPITIKPRNFDLNPPPIADKEEKEILDSLVNKRIQYDTVIIHLTPDLYPMYAEQNKYNIGFMAWETDRLHPKWAASIEAVNEVWVPCQWNKEALERSGVTKPITVIPHGIDPNMFDGADSNSFSIDGLNKDTYKFYSIFQWNSRKNPEGLLRSYFNTFTPGEDVALVLKTYIGGRTGNDKEQIRNLILNIKRDMNIGYYPKVILIGDLLSNTQMLGLHKYGDCYIGLPRGEGWGLPFFQAGLCGNPVISTNGGGQLEFLNGENSYLVDSMMTFVSMMVNFNPWYLGAQRWYEPNLIHASELMRGVFENKKAANGKAAVLKESIINNFSWGKVADKIVGRLSNI